MVKNNETIKNYRNKKAMEEMNLINDWYELKNNKIN